MNRLVFTKVAIDLFLWYAASYLAFILIVGLSHVSMIFATVIIVTLLTLPLKGSIIYLFGFHRQSWTNIGIQDLFTLFSGSFLYIISGTLIYILTSRYYTIPAGIAVIEGMLGFFLMGGSRLSVRIIRENRSYREAQKKGFRNVLIAGAGDSGTILAGELLRHPESGLKPVGYLDDDYHKRMKSYHGLPVLGKIYDLPEVITSQKIDEVLISMPSQSGSVIRDIIELSRQSGVECRSVPSLNDILSGKKGITQLRDVDVADLLRRKTVKINNEEVEKFLKNKKILVTGGGGSIGSEIVRQLMRYGEHKIIVIDRDENSIYKLQNEIKRNFRSASYELLIADITNRTGLERIFTQYRPDTVIHAAAYKHVPLMEEQPGQAVLNNVGGTRNLVDMALRYGVGRFVNVSTDKAVNPVSIMGATKRITEELVRWASDRAGKGQSFVSVRFGNVLGSRGSVVPLFKEQIKNGGPITVTHPDMSRYFMTIPEASMLVLQSTAMVENGSVYVLDMGEPVRIVDIAKDLVELSGMNFESDIALCYTGIRPGEKISEELFTLEEIFIKTTHDKIFEVKREKNVIPDYGLYVQKLLENVQFGEPNEIRQMLKELTPTYSYNEKASGILTKLGNNQI
jgi:FlaA1/EpsC-like NDP-sugar epimerase